MSKKLLSEAQVRRFQSLANITSINEMDHAYKRDEPVEEMYKEEEHAEEAPMEEEMHEELPAADEPEEMEMSPADEPEEMDQPEEADLEVDEDLVERFMDAADAIKEMAAALAGAEMDDQPEEDES